MSGSKRIIYARGFPYGAPMCLLRGGGTRDEAVKAFLKDTSKDLPNWWWSPDKHAWESYMYAGQLRATLLKLREMGYEVSPKESMHPSYIIDLEAA